MGTASARAAGAAGIARQDRNVVNSNKDSAAAHAKEQMEHMCSLPFRLIVLIQSKTAQPTQQG
jgi:hypothetical protein